MDAVIARESFDANQNKKHLKRNNSIETKRKTNAYKSKVKRCEKNWSKTKRKINLLVSLNEAKRKRNGIWYARFASKRKKWEATMEKWFEYHTIPPSQSLHVRCLVPGRVEPRTSQADRAMAYFCWVVRTATIGPAVWCSSANIKWEILCALELIQVSGDLKRASAAHLFKKICKTKYLFIKLFWGILL